ncbi:tetraacyldisaccharide 4'-kinase [Oryzifoliimicrobium ureilyticus]|uniref:tetraacyldisaccharide 4'-kinase n=1 Tax=Oryzifoliimicrobium ureilyticus TaxID=3113724 RepID=UPI003075F2CA
MVSEAPPFWWEKADWRARVLFPFAAIYGYVAGRRMLRAQPPAVGVPVICIGNFTVGGAGKTPTAIAMARVAIANGFKPGFLSRGYGGSIDVTTVVDPHHHRATAVGDEPLLLAREATTVIARRRIDGARRLVAEGVDLIIMDDGFQSARLTIDYALLVIDAGRGLGNGHIVPAGPVRAPLGQQLARTDGILKVGDGNAADRVVRTAARAAKPFFEAKVEVSRGGNLVGKRVLAFAGIADPSKFFRTVEASGAEIVQKRAFGDHEHLRDDEISELLTEARQDGLLIVTTAKDFVRLSGHHGKSAELAAACHVVEIDMVFDDPEAPMRIIETAVSRFRQRRLQASSTKRFD